MPIYIPACWHDQHIPAFKTGPLLAMVPQRLRTQATAVSFDSGDMGGDQRHLHEQ